MHVTRRSSKTVISSADPVNNCNCTALRKASRRISNLYDTVLAPAGLKSTQYSILSEISRWTGEPPTVRELAEALVMDRSTLGHNLRPLERDQLVSLEDGATDRRRKHVALTRKGRMAFAEARKLWHIAQGRFEENFGTVEAAKLRGTLLRIAADSIPVRSQPTSASPDRTLQ